MIADMKPGEKTALLFGPYQLPVLKVGSRASCLYRDAEVVIYGWTGAPISWPLCYLAGTRAVARGILVNEELVRAIKHESGLAIQHWWDVSRGTVRRWRRA